MHFGVGIMSVSGVRRDEFTVPSLAEGSPPRVVPVCPRAVTPSGHVRALFL